MDCSVQELTEKEKQYFAKIIQNELAHYLRITIIWNLFFGITSIILLPLVSLNNIPSLIMGVAIIFFDILGIVQIVNMPQKKKYWRVDSFHYTRGTITNVIHTKHRNQSDTYELEILCDDEILLKAYSMNVWRKSDIKVVVASHDKTRNNYIFSADHNLYTEIYKKNSLLSSS